MLLGVVFTISSFSGWYKTITKWIVCMKYICGSCVVAERAESIDLSECNTLTRIQSNGTWKRKNQVNNHLRVYITNVYVKYCLYTIGSEYQRKENAKVLMQLLIYAMGLSDVLNTCPTIIHSKWTVDRCI